MEVEGEREARGGERGAERRRERAERNSTGRTNKSPW